LLTIQICEQSALVTFLILEPKTYQPQGQSWTRDFYKRYQHF